MGKEEKKWYWLCGIQGLGRKRLEKLGNYFEEKKENIPELVMERPAAELEKVIGKAAAANVEKAKSEWKRGETEKRWEEMKRQEIFFCPFVSESFPARLKEIPDPPAALYFKGRLPEETHSAVAIIGARENSVYWEQAARWFASQLAQAGVDIISGMARGIDGTAQEAALNAGGASYAVLGCGVDICYPKQNLPIYERMKHQGGILSEYPPGTMPQSRLFPPRNRLISGLCDVLLVVEARPESGTLITVDMALEQGKDIYAVPGRISDALSAGCNRLIQSGAGMALSPQEIFQALGIQKRSLIYRKKEEKGKEEQILEVLKDGPAALQQIYEQCRKKWSLDEVTEVLVELCIKGTVEMKNGYYSSKNGPEIFRTEFL